MPKLRTLLIHLCLGAGMAAGCLPILTTPPAEPTPEPGFSEAAQTIAAELTAISDTALPTPDQSVTATPTPTETLPPTSTPAPTETPMPVDTPSETPETGLPTPLAAGQPAPNQTETSLNLDQPKASLGEPDWSDDFASGGDWPLYNDGHVTMQLSDGALEMTSLVANRKDPWDSWMATDAILSDVYLELSATPGECSGLDRYGMIVRANPQATKAYMFGFSCGGEYSLRLWDGEKLFMLQAWQISQFINRGPNQTNRLGLLARGQTLALYANDTLLTTIVDETYREGAFGLFSGAANTDRFTVRFDQMAYWIIQNGGAP